MGGQWLNQRATKNRLKDTATAEEIMLTYELEIEYIAVTELGVHDLYTEEDKDLWVDGMIKDGFEEGKDFIIYKKISKNT